MKLIIKYSDYIGASASGLCFIHCLATPILFLSQASLVSIGNEMLFLWQSLNFFFLTISAIAVYYSIKNSSNLSVNTLLFFTWFILLCLIINEAWENKDQVSQNSDKSLKDAVNQIIDDLDSGKAYQS